MDTFFKVLGVIAAIWIAFIVVGAIVHALWWLIVVGAVVFAGYYAIGHKRRGQIGR